jgi:hypothetical protein
MESRTIFEVARETLLNRFIGKNQVAYDQFIESEAETARIAATFADYERSLPAERQLVEAHCERLLFIKSADFSGSIVEGLSSGQLLEAIIRELSPRYFLAQQADAVIPVLRKKMADREAEFEKFKSENRATLKKLGLI